MLREMCCQQNKLPNDLAVSFIDSVSVFNTDGTIRTKANLPTASQAITVVATVTSESATVNITKEYVVTVVNATDRASADASVFVYNTAVAASVVVVGDTAPVLVPIIARVNDGDKV
ncbi:hypothetical protein [Desulfotomaculum sp. 1211_IL3151]|uniref:hypothetical protein n=1 Tax=Desulfotomaculum sp. 1211_IL3151 TaxID=3084055 RepID=UPI002FDA6204